MDASPTLRNKKDLIEAFVDTFSVDGEIDHEWRAFIAAKREAELDAIIRDENLRPEETRDFVETAFRDGAIRTTGTAITKVLPPTSRFSADGGHGEKKQRSIQKLGAFFERFFGLALAPVDAEQMRSLRAVFIDPALYGIDAEAARIPAQRDRIAWSGG